MLTPTPEATKLIRGVLVGVGLTVLTACQTASSGATEPLSAGKLTEEYERSSDSVRHKYDGREITVRGYMLNAATPPRDGADQGSVLLEEKGRDRIRPITCWFSREQAGSTTMLTNVRSKI